MTSMDFLWEVTSNKLLGTPVTSMDFLWEVRSNEFAVGDEITLNAGKVKQAAFADDLTGAGKLSAL